MKKQHHTRLKRIQRLFVGLSILFAFTGPTMGDQRISVTPKKSHEQVILRHNVVVDDDLIHLGDLFEGIADKAKIAVAYAPAPGKRGVFDANWLFRVANSYGLKWRPKSLKEHVQVRRQSFTIEREEIADNILSKLINLGADPTMKLELSNRSIRLHVAANSDANLEVENAHYDPHTKRFSAYVSTPGSKPVRITGRLKKMIKIPVFSRRIIKNELIKPEDVMWIETTSDRVQNDIVIHIEDLIGKTPKRVIRAGSLIRKNQVQRPILVEKGSLVTMILKTPAMVLTSQGRAIDPGADGDVIRITNTQSNKVVQAVVSGAGIASITPASQLALNLESTNE